MSEPRESPDTLSGSLGGFYELRFDARAEAAKDAIWREVCRHLQRYVPRDGVVLDVACDRGYFIRHISAVDRWAIDVRDMSAHLGAGVTFRQLDGPGMDRSLPNEHFAAVFMSNYLEHPSNADAVLTQLRASWRTSGPGAR